MQTQLAGPDGKTPAIDARTGQPLTMEEMLRRNGIVATGNNVSMMGAPAAQVAAPVPVNTANSASAAALASRAGANPAVVASTTPTNGGDPASPAALPVAPEQIAQMEQLEASGADENSISALEGLGLVAAGTAAAYGAYLAMKGMRNGNGNIDPSTDLGSAGSNRNPQIIEGQFTEVPRVQDAATRRTLPAPQKRIGNNSRSAVAKVKAEQAARGTTGNDVINAQQAPRTVKEPLDAGLNRTIGKDSEIVRMLKKNPGLLKLLSTGL